MFGLGAYYFTGMTKFGKSCYTKMNGAQNMNTKFHLRHFKGKLSGNGPQMSPFLM